MTALAEQHEAWVGARSRLWKVPPAVRKVSPVHKIRNPPHFAPFNFYAYAHASNIIRLVALRHGLGYLDILGQSRIAPIMAARKVAVRLVRSHCHLSTVQMGRIFHRDHSSIVNLLRGKPKTSRQWRKQAKASDSPVINTSHTNPEPDRRIGLETA